MDYPWAVGKVEEFVQLLEKGQDTWDLRVRTHNAGPYRQIDAQLGAKLMTVVKIAERHEPGLVEGLVVQDGSYIYPHKSQLRSATILLGSLQDAEEVAEHLGPVGPRLAASQLHSIVWHTAVEDWDNGNLRGAVQAAATAVFDIHLVAHYGRSDVQDGRDRITQAFTVARATPEAPRLRFTRFDHGSASWRSIHEGVMHFGQGCAQAIRNVTTHNLDQPSEDVALECLASLSLLARWIDEAQLTTDEPELPQKTR